MRRLLWSVAVLTLALAGCTAAPPPPVSVPSASVPSGAAPSSSGVPAELTTGLLMRSAHPSTVAIPKLGVTSRLIDLGTNPDGTMQVPDDASTVGWFTGAPTPGALGPAVLAGHVDWKGTKGAFARLTELAPGDQVDVDREDGTRAVFTVRRVEHHPKDAFPTDAVYGPIDHAGLRLITCGGEFDKATGHYRDNIVVFADLTASATR